MRPPRRTAFPRLTRRPAVVVTGAYGERVIGPVVDRIERLAGRELRILTVPNSFFGGNTAVAGLMVGEDIQRTLAEDRGPVGAYILPDVALSSDTFIDDMPLADVVQHAKAPVVVAEATVAGLLGAVR